MTYGSGILRRTLLAPDIVEASLEGRQLSTTPEVNIPTFPT